MNIFATDPCPVISAKNLDTKRVIKMILESAQMLCTALRHHGASHLAKYRETHKNHPSNVWARETRSNYEWLLKHFDALLSEYTRYCGKHHACEGMLHNLTVGAQYIPAGPLTPIANCAARSDMNISFKHISDVHLAYKLYLIKRWETDKRMPFWRTIPRWHKAYTLLGQTFNRFIKPIR
jgi:hypothetical protein